MRTETRISYGLRDKTSGKFLLIELTDRYSSGFSGETASLTLDGYGDIRRFELDEPVDLIRLLEENPFSLNSSRTRPTWNGYSPDKVIPVRFEVESDFDDVGGDPVATREKVMVAELPLRFQGKMHRTRSDAPARLLRDVFGQAYAEVEASEGENDPIYAEIQIVDATEAGANIGAVVTTSSMNSGQIDALVPIPETWPRDRQSGIDLDDPKFRLALVRISRYRVDVPVRDFVSNDFDPSVASVGALRR